MNVNGMQRLVSSVQLLTLKAGRQDFLVVNLGKKNN